MSIWVGALLVASQIALVVLSPGLTHAAVKDFADVAPLVEFVRPLMTDPERVVHHGVGGCRVRLYA